MTFISRRQFQLRPADGADAGYLYSLAAQFPELWPRVCHRGLPNPQQFEHETWLGVLILLVVEDSSTGQPLGVASVFDADHYSGTAWIEVILPQRGAQDEGEITDALLSYAFETWRFRKVYLRTESFRPPALDGVSWVAKEEAVLRQNTLHDGFLWDTVTTAFYQEPLAGNR